jgi:steroid delta-isomerase-like uncharacterized protein
VDSLAAAWTIAWNAHDVDAVVAWYADDADHRMAGGNTYSGADAIRAMVERTLGAYPDLAFEVRDAFADGRRFAVEYTMRGTQRAAVGDRPGTGRAVTVDGALVGTADAAGRVIACVDYLDHHDLRRQLGLVSEARGT